MHPKRRPHTLLAAAIGTLWFAWPAWANHDLRQGLGDLFGPLSWGLYVIVPMPFLLVGIIAFRIWRAVRAQERERAKRDERPGGELPWPESRLN